MIIAIPCVSDCKTSGISERLARSPFFAIADTDQKEVRFFKNNFSDIGAGAGREMVAFMEASNAEIIMTREIGLMVQQLAVERRLRILLLPETITRVDQILNYLKIAYHEE
jgi:predicted Fe-Mo cluster-binding NifX family protein